MAMSQVVTPPIPYVRQNWKMRQINASNNNIITCFNLFLKLYTYFLSNSTKEGVFNLQFTNIPLALL